MSEATSLTSDKVLMAVFQIPDADGEHEYAWVTQPWNL